MFKYETHLHTSAVSACASCSPAGQVDAYIARGYAGIIVTDHFGDGGNSTCPGGLPWARRVEYLASGYRQAKREGGRRGLDVFFGWEYTIQGWDFLTYGLDIEFLLAHPEIESLSVERYSALVRRSGGYLAQAHPYREGWWIANPYPVSPDCIDGVEIFNASIRADENKKAHEFARMHDLPVQAGSDAHHKDLPFASGITLPEKAQNIHDIIRALIERKAGLILPA
jgi:hypothetical protein